MLCTLLNVKYLPNDWYAIFKNITRFSSLDWKEIVFASGEKICERGLRKKLNVKNVIVTKKQFCQYKKEINKHKADIGIPQGSPISAVLANVYMMEFDKGLHEYAAKNKGMYMRYSDDFILILPYKDNRIDLYKEFLFSYVETRKDLVQLQEEKTDVYIYDTDKIEEYPGKDTSYIDYLGFIFDGKTIKLRPRSITKYYYRMRRKAYNIIKRQGVSPNGSKITAERLYSLYGKSKPDGDPTFVDYAIRARKILDLKDPEADALIKGHKQKIAHILKKLR